MDFAPKDSQKEFCNWLVKPINGAMLDNYCCLSGHSLEYLLQKILVKLKNINNLE